MPFSFLRSHLAGTGTDEIEPPPPGDTALRAGHNGILLSEFGTGPGGGLKYRSTVIAPLVSEIIAIRQAIIDHDMRIAINLAGNRPSWTDPVGSCMNYNQSKYETRTRRWTVAGGATLAQFNTLKACLDEGSAIVFLADELNHQDFCDSVSPAEANDMGLLVKSIWPNALTALRMSASVITNVFGVPPGGYTGVDYLFAQYEGAAAAGTPFATHFGNEKTLAAVLNVGIIPGINGVDGGLGGAPHFPVSITGVPACWDHLNTGSSSGVTKGSYTGTDPDGTQYTCGNLPAKTICGARFMPSPAWIRKFADYVVTDLDAPMATGFSPYSGPARAIYLPKWQNWTQFQNALIYYVQKCESRANFNGLRNPK